MDKLLKHLYEEMSAKPPNVVAALTIMALMVEDTNWAFDINNDGQRTQITATLTIRHGRTKLEPTDTD